MGRWTVLCLFLLLFCFLVAGDEGLTTVALSLSCFEGMFILVSPVHLNGRSVWRKDEASVGGLLRYSLPSRILGTWGVLAGDTK